MIRRAFVMLGLSVSAFFHRLRHDLAKEIVVAISCLIILATFFYVFNDFLNVEIASLSPAMRAAFAKVASAVTLAGAAGFAGKLIADECQGERTLSSFARVTGEDNQVIRLFYGLHGVLAISLCHGLGWWVNQRWLYRLAPLPGIWAALLMLGLSAFTALRRKKSRADLETAIQTKTTLLSDKSLMNRLIRRSTRQQGASKEAVLAGKTRSERLSQDSRLTAEPVSSVGTALVTWRIVQIAFRHRLSRMCLGIGAFMLVPMIWVGLRGAPPFVAATCGLGAGFVASLALIFFIGDDVGQAWTERGAGVSHGQFVRAYEAISWLLGSGYAIVGAGLFFVATYFGVLASLNIGTHKAPSMASSLLHGSKVFCITLLPFLTAPWLMFQIDARRPWITAVVSLLVNLFIGTALLASWLSVILVPLLRYYGLQSQNGRFYRA